LSDQGVNEQGVPPIAIVGMGCRFPGASNPDAYWRLLREGRCSIGEIPPDRFDVEGIFDPRPGRPGKISNRWGGFLEDVDRFDADFFGILPREALHMDPQQRLLMEVSWEALEDGGQAPSSIAGTSVGVFVGMLYNDYEDFLFRDSSSFDIYGLLGCVRNAAAGHLSYVLGLQGPSMVIDTGCSASLTATHLACQSLWSGDCSLALAGGVTLLLEPHPTIAFSHARLLAEDGRCKFGDAGADGFVRSEGVGMVLLKPLAAAQADGDAIYAVILGSAVNNDGRSGGSMATPGEEGQKALLRRAYRRAGVAPADVDYVEAHGTGTPVGDPVEIETLGRFFGEGRPPERRLRVGSAKSNLGHTEGAAGVAGLIKAALSLSHGELPPSLHVAQPNPAIAWSELPVTIQRELTPWPARGGPRRAGVSSFGMTGCNAHVVLEEPPSRQPREEVSESAPPEVGILTLSARHPEALADLAASYRQFLADGAVRGCAGWPEVCRAASVRRTHHEHRMALTAGTAEEAAEALEAFARGESRMGMSSGRVSVEKPKLAFVFPGQGSQWLGMGRELMERETVFRRALEACDREIRELAGWSLLEELAASEERSRLDEVDVVQPTIFSLQVALAALWRSWGVEPAVCIGQSLGEVAAAHVAGALSLRDAARIICGRSRLVRSATSGRGAMAVVELSMEEALAAIQPFAGRLSVAVTNGPKSTVVSGDLEPLEALLEGLGRDDVFVRRVKVDYASHSPHMDPLRPNLLRVLDGLAPRAGTVPICSTVTGRLTDGSDLGAEYWARNLREPVLFAEGLERLLDSEHGVFLEISAHPIVLGSMQQALHHWRREALVLASMRRGEERSSVLGTLGSLYTAGVPIDWKRVHPGVVPHVRLPGYPWRRQRFWIDRPAAATRGSDSSHPLLGRHVRCATSGADVWETELSFEDLPYLRDHAVNGSTVFPAAGLLEMVLAAAGETFQATRCSLAEVRFARPLPLTHAERRLLQLELAPACAGTVSFQLSSSPSASSREPLLRHAAGTLDLRAEPAAADGNRLEALQRFREACTEETERREVYRKLSAHGWSLGPRFRNVGRLWRRDSEAVARLAVAKALQPELSAYGVHPAVLDTCFQVMLAAYLGASGTARREPDALVPVAIDGLQVYQAAAGAWCRTTLRDASAPNVFAGDIELFDDDGTLLLKAWGVRWQTYESTRGVTDGFHRLAWRESPWPEEETERGAWIVLADEDGTGESLADRLESAGDVCLVVRRGAECDVRGLRNARLRVERPADYAHVLAAAAGILGAPCRGVVHLWSLDGVSAGETSLSTLRREEAWGSMSAVYLAQALAASGWDRRARLFLVTRGAQQVPPASAGDPGGLQLSVAQACLWGLGRVLASEHPEMRCRLIDLPSGKVEAPSVDALVREVCCRDRENQVALRDGARLAARLLASRPLEDEAVGAPGRSVVRSDGTYLVTGGLGGIGLSVAEWLVKRGARHLALVSRRPLSVSAQTAIGRLRAAGASVVALRADVADEDQLAAALARIEESQPPLAGIFHAAGITDDQLLEDIDAERFHAVTAAKVEGTWKLHELTARKPLDVFVTFSSAAVVLGSPGLSSYAAANAFMDTLAYHRRALGLPALSVNWGLWTEVGLIRGLADAGQRLVQRGFRGFSPEQGTEALERLLRIGSTQVGVMPMDWQRWRRFYPAVAELPFFAEVFQEHGEGIDEDGANLTACDRQSLLSTSPEERREHVVSYLRGLLSRLLGVSADRMPPEATLRQLGVDSLVSVEVKNSLETDLGVTVSMVSLLKGPSVARLAREIAGALAPDAAAGQERREAGFEDDRSGPIRPVAWPHSAARPLSFVQERIWFVSQLEEPGYNDFLTTFSITGGLEVRHLRQAAAEIFRRHEVLRIRFEDTQGRPAARPDVAVERAIQVVDLAGLAAGPREAESRRLATGGLRCPLDLVSGPAVRIHLVCLDRRRHLVLLNFHHIVMDRWSSVVLLEELGRLYRDFAAGRSSSLPRLAVQYADFAQWQRGWLRGEVLADQVEYWRRALAGARPSIAVPTDRPPRGHAGIRRGGHHPFVLPEPLGRGVGELSVGENVTAFMVVLAVFTLLLSRYSKQEEDLVVGVNVADRPRRETEGLIGCFLNTLALRTDLTGDPSFRQLLGRVRATVLEGIRHQDAPYDQVVRAVQPERQLGRSPLFQVVLDFGNAHLPESVLGAFAESGLEVSQLLNYETVRWDLHLFMEEQRGEFSGAWVYDADLFNASTIVRMHRHFETLLGNLLERPDTPLSRLEMISEEEQAAKARAARERHASRRRRLMEVKVRTAETELRPETVG
jgi:myxalamid-type polyketide synthase MxaE and MxaD